MRADTWEPIKVGDTVVDVLGHERLVLVVLSNVFLSSRVDAPTIADGWYTLAQAQEMGMKLIKEQ